MWKRIGRGIGAIWGRFVGLGFGLLIGIPMWVVFVFGIMPPQWSFLRFLFFTLLSLLAIVSIAGGMRDLPRKPRREEDREDRIEN
jgi:hypothetical protein